MFPRRHRLKKDAFPTALSRGIRVSSTNISATILKEIEGFAVVISKKTLKLAVDRHRAKRRVLGALRSLPLLPKGAVLFPKAAVLTMPLPELKKELEKLLSNMPSRP